MLCLIGTSLCWGLQTEKGREQTVHAWEESCSPKPPAENLSWPFRLAAMTEKGLWFPACCDHA